MQTLQRKDACVYNFDAELDRLFELAREILPRMGALTKESKATFIALQTEWSEFKMSVKAFDRRLGKSSELLEQFYRKPEWLNYRRVRDSWDRKTPPAKARRKLKDQRRNRSSEWKIAHAAKMREFRARKRGT